MEKVELEYIFHTTPKILFKQLTTPSNLAGWFAQNVDVQDSNTFIFHWADYRMDALVTIDYDKYYIKFDWLDEDEKYTEITLSYNRLSKDTSMKIIDIAENSEDAEDLKKLWDETIKRLKLRLGLPPKVMK